MNPAAGRRSSWRRYGGGAALTLLVIAGRLAMDPWWGRQQNRHLVFLPAVIVVAWLFGFGPGLLSAIMCVAALGFFWMGGGGGTRAGAELVLFFLVSAAICSLVRSLQRARERADAARKSREQVLTAVAHDLRAPLTTVMVTSSALQQGTPDTELVRRRLRVIDRAAVRMENLIRDLLDAAAFEHGRVPMTLRSEPVGPIVQEAIDLFTPLAQEAGVNIEAQVANPGVLLTCDRQRILQALGNLLGNAIKFTPAGGRISVRVEGGDADRLVSFVVDDTGSGIAPEHMPHIFERYWNADTRGIGLGLYIARSIVQAHGGEIRAHSAPGSGASFVFTLPRTQQGQPPATAPKAPDAPSQLRHLPQRE